MQQIANILKGMSVSDAVNILQNVKREIKWQSKVAFDKDHFTKEPEKITMQYKPSFGVGLMDALLNMECPPLDGTKNEE